MGTLNSTIHTYIHTYRSYCATVCFLSYAHALRAQHASAGSHDAARLPVRLDDVTTDDVTVECRHHSPRACHDMTRRSRLSNTRVFMQPTGIASRPVVAICSTLHSDQCICNSFNCDSVTLNTFIHSFSGGQNRISILFINRDFSVLAI